MTAEYPFGTANILKTFAAFCPQIRILSGEPYKQALNLGNPRFVHQQRQVENLHANKTQLWESRFVYNAADLHSWASARIPLPIMGILFPIIPLDSYGLCYGNTVEAESLKITV